MDVRGTRRRHARIADPFARNCVKLHPMTHTVGEYLARVRQTVQARGESRARMTSWLFPADQSPPAAGRRDSAVPRRSITRRAIDEGLSTTRRLDAHNQLVIRNYILIISHVYLREIPN